MFQEKALLTFYAETPVHMGAGQSVSYVDLPVQRERITGFPTLWASGIKGVIRDLATRKWNNDKNKVEVIFGPEESAEEFASCISITDAKILLYPVRSVRGVFAWITCPFVLKRFKEDLESINISFKLNETEISISEPQNDNEAIVSPNSILKLSENIISLEEFVFNIQKNSEIDTLGEFIKNLLPQNELINSLTQRLVIVKDDIFKDFVNYAVEIRTRIKIEQSKGTVESGALFTEEFIPSESIFYSLIFMTNPYTTYDEINSAERVKEELNSLLNNKLLQLGGDETIGMGFMKVKFYYT